MHEEIKDLLSRRFREVEDSMKLKIKRLEIQPKSTIQIDKGMFIEAHGIVTPGEYLG
jgi:hypothetical protein